MPFTGAHAVVALPFVRTPLVPGAVAIGAMTPDFPLFFAPGPTYSVTHHWLGALLVDVPLALVLFALWRVLLRPAAPYLLPRWFAARVPSVWWQRDSGWWELWGGPEVDRRRRGIAAVVLLLSLAIGVATHLVWDAFTHHDRWGTDLFPALNGQYGPFPGWRWAQYISSVFGMALIGAWIGRWLVRREPRPVAQPLRGLRIAVGIALPASLVAGAILVTLFREPVEVSGWRFFIQRTGTTGAAIYVILLGAVTVWMRFRMREIAARTRIT